MINSILISLLGLSWFAFSSSRECTITPNTVTILHEFYNATNGPNWVWYASNLTIPWNFTTNANPCTQKWQGIGCLFGGTLLHATCSISTLTLVGLNLSGTLPSSLDQLTVLEQLILNINSIHGPLPHLKGLQQLTFLNLQQNNLTGTIPTSIIELPMLAKLYLDENYLSGRLKLGNISISMMNLYLQKNLLTGPFHEIFNGLNSSKSYKLGALQMQSNQFTSSIPMDMCYLKELYAINLSENRLNSTIPTCIGHLRALEQLDLNFNSLGGELPIGEWNMSKLMYLDVSSNLFSFNISELCRGHLPKLQEAYLYLNDIYGSIPAVQYSFTKLQVLDLGYNQLTGTIPEEIYSLHALTILIVYGNRLHGSISPQIVSLTNLLTLSLGNNDLTGTLPAVIGNMTTLTSIFINDCYLQGPIPDVFERMHKLTKFFLNNNQFTGTFPTSLFNTSTLFEINLSNNSNMSCTLPEELPKWINMAFIGLNDIGLTGNLKFLSSLSEIQEFYAADNYLTGSIPSIQNSQLLAVQLNGNFLTSSLPPSFDQYQQLYELVVFNNALTGDISNFYLNASNMTILMMQSNSFTGSIDQLVASLVGAKNLYNLDFSSNHLTGTLPESLGLISSLQYLFLGSNCFEGSIPESLCDLDRVQSISLDGLTASCSQQPPRFIDNLIHSYFTRYIDSSIPPCIVNNMSSLTSLKLSGNGLTGTLPNIPPTSPLTYLSASNNRLTSTIPTSIQTHPFTYLDLSFNHFNGTLQGFQDNPFTNASEITVYLQGNRLSGELPQSLLAVGSINVLTDNIFSCSSELPAKDPYYHAYSCGSNTLNLSLIVFFSLLVLIGLMAVNLTAFQSRYESYQRAVSVLRKYRQEVISLLAALELPRSPVYYEELDIKLYLLLLRFLRRLAWTACIAIILIGCVMYPSLKAAYHTVTYQYGWLVSSAFMTGKVAAGMVLMFHVLMVLFLIRSILLRNLQFKEMTDDIEQEHDRFKRTHLTQQQSQESVSTCAIFGVSVSGVGRLPSKYSPTGKQLLFLLVFLVNIVIVTTANILYSLVYIESQDATAINLTRIALSLFQLLWGMVVVPSIFNSVDSISRYRPVRQSVYLACIYFFNNALVPCLASAIALSSCFKNIFTGFSTISTVNSWSTKEVIAIDLYGIAVTSEQSQSVSFQPPFVYSGQCSSGILVSYIPVFMLMYMFQIVFIPLAYTVLCHIPHEKLPPLMYDALPSISWPRLLTHSRGFPVKTHNHISSLLVDIGLLMTFGCTSPPLALIICVEMTISTIFCEIMIGRYVYINRNAKMEGDTRLLKVLEPVDMSVYRELTTKPIHRNWSLLGGGGGEEEEVNPTTNTSPAELVTLEFLPVEWLEKSCRGMWRSPAKCIWPIIWMCIPFFILLCFDIAGTDVDTLLWIIPLNLGTVIFLYCSRHYTVESIVQWFSSMNHSKRSSQPPSFDAVESKLNSSFKFTLSPIYTSSNLSNLHENGIELK